MYRFKAPNSRYLRDTLQTEGAPLMYLEASDDHMPRNWQGLSGDLQVYL
jgi:hypothetical protein